MSTALLQENKELKSKVLLLNNILAKFRNKDAKNYLIYEEQKKLIYELKSKNDMLQNVNEQLTKELSSVKEKVCKYKSEIEELTKLKKEFAFVQTNFKSEMEKFKEVEVRMKKAEKLNRMFIMNKENKTPILLKGNIKIVSPRNKVSKDLKKIIYNKTNASAFEKKWSLASTIENEDEFDNVLRKTIDSLIHSLSEIFNKKNFEQRIASFKSSLMRSFIEMTKSDVLQSIPTDIMNSMINYKGLLKSSGKSK